MLYTRAGAQAWANRPPFTAERRLRMMFISTMSRPAGQQLPGDVLEFIPGDQRLFKQRAASARQQEQHGVIRRQPAHQLQRLGGGGKAVAVRHRVPCLMAYHPGDFPLDMAVLGHHHPAVHMAQRLHGGMGHLPGGFARRHWEEAAGAEEAAIEEEEEAPPFPSTPWSQSRSRSFPGNRVLLPV